MTNVQMLYRHRFKESDLPTKRRIWKTLCRVYFDRLIPANAAVVDLACGYGEFINNIRAAHKFAVDINPDSEAFLNSDVTFVPARADSMPQLADASTDVVFTSNFLEHLENKPMLDAVFREVHRILRPGGRFIIMGPNIRYVYDQYWDFYDHLIPLSHLSVEEALVLQNFEVERIHAKFLPYTTRSALPKADFLIDLYLRLPFAWSFLGKQFLVVAVTPS